ncbi:MAG: CaiB/BaiF CoA transferase family protein, partial [Vicinamibacteria bacterium]
MKILDLTRLLPGPYSTMLLGDMGADVLKIENPNGGDYSRWVPPLREGLSAYFMHLNRNKRSLSLNLKSPKGVEVLMDIVPRYDALMEQFRPGVCDRLGIGYEAVKGRNPSIVYASLTGYGQTGPFRDRAGHDLNYMGIAGAASITGVRGGPLVIPGVQVADLGGGALMMALGLLAALLHRQKTGEGQFLDVSMLDGCVSWLSPHAAEFLLEGGESPRAGEMRLNGGPICYRIYETREGGPMSMCALEPKFWESFCRAVEKPHLILAQYSMG